jgi:hypothetical protein
VIEVFVEGIGLRGPGLEGWAASRPVLAGAAHFAAAPVALPSPSLLPPAERRRAVPPVKLALAVGAEALRQAGRDPSGVATVFTSSGGDGETIHEILRVLATAEREVSPTRFHNSVHNAPSGYWTIATGSREPSTTLCAHDASFAAGLLEAAVQTAVDRHPVALIAYDLPYPEPIHTVRPIGSVYGVALLLVPVSADNILASLRISTHHDGGAATTLTEPALEKMRASNPAARSLPLLVALAGFSPAAVRIPGAAGMLLDIAVRPS